MFLDIQRMSWRLLKDQFYYEFIREPIYPKLLSRRRYHLVRLD